MDVPSHRLSSLSELQSASPCSWDGRWQKRNWGPKMCLSSRIHSVRKGSGLTMRQRRHEHQDCTSGLMLECFGTSVFPCFHKQNQFWHKDAKKLCLSLFTKRSHLSTPPLLSGSAAMVRRLLRTCFLGLKQASWGSPYIVRAPSQLLGSESGCQKLLHISFSKESSPSSLWPSLKAYFKLYLLWAPLHPLFPSLVPLPLLNPSATVVGPSLFLFQVTTNSKLCS